MKKKFKIFIDCFVVLIFCLTISCGQKIKSTETVNSQVDTIKQLKNIKVLKLSKEVNLIRHSDTNSKYWDILEINNLKIDSLVESCMLDTTENNIYIKNIGKSKAFVIFDDYLIISKSQVQVLWVQIYNLKTKNKLSSFLTEEVAVDTLSKEIFLIRDRGKIRNYIIKYKLDNDKIVKLDSVKNTDKAKKIMGLEIK